MPKLYNLARMTTATTGTGTITLGSAVAPFLTFAQAGIADGDVVSYSIIDGVANSEIGTGVYTSAGTTLTRTVTKSTNANAAISLSGSAHVLISARAEDIREKLAAARTFYVRTNGSDSNNGLADTAGGAFLTIQKAIDETYKLDLNNNNVTIQVRSGTYTGAAFFGSTFTGQGSATVLLTGDTTTPANVLISVTSLNAIFATDNAKVSVSGLKIATTTAGSGLAATAGAHITIVGLMDFGACADYHITAQTGGLVTSISVNYNITAAATVHWFTGATGFISVQLATITITGTPAFSSAFASAGQLSSMLVNANTFSGSATGTRYSISGNASIDTNGAGATYLPGNVAGSTSTGGQYI